MKRQPWCQRSRVRSPMGCRYYSFQRAKAQSLPLTSRVDFRYFFVLQGLVLVRDVRLELKTDALNRRVLRQSLRSAAGNLRCRLS